MIPARLPPLRPVKIDKIPLHASVEVAGDGAGVRAARRALLRARAAGRFASASSAATEWTFADKHNWARRGVLVAHIGFVIIAAGTTIYWARGFSGETTVLSGTDRRDPANGRDCFALDQFGYRSQPDRYQERHGLSADRLRLARDRYRQRRRAAQTMTVRVNQPDRRRRHARTIRRPTVSACTFALTQRRQAGRRALAAPAQGRRSVRHPRHDARDPVPRSWRRSTGRPAKPTADPRAQRSGRRCSKPSTADVSRSATRSSRLNNRSTSAPAGS